MSKEELVLGLRKRLKTFEPHYDGNIPQKIWEEIADEAPDDLIIRLLSHPMPLDAALQLLEHVNSTDEWLTVVETRAGNT